MNLSTVLAFTLVLHLGAVSTCTHVPSSQQLGQEASNPVPRNWQRVELSRFSISLPPDMKWVGDKSIDSEVWVFQSEGMRLETDFGPHSNDLTTYHDWPDFHEGKLKIDSRNAKFCTFRHAPRFMDSADGDRVYIAALYVPDIGLGKNGLNLWLTSKTAKGQEIARTIFASIKFK
jgi:hypothetical protein